MSVEEPQLSGGVGCREDANQLNQLTSPVEVQLAVGHVAQFDNVVSLISVSSVVEWESAFASPWGRGASLTIIQLPIRGSSGSIEGMLESVY